MPQLQRKLEIPVTLGTGKDPLTIAICGIRGIPACYGGFETFADELSTRLVEQGHRVIVYGRTHCIDYQDRFYRGVEIRLLPAPKHKYFETPVHTLRCLFDLVRRPVDVVLVCNAANSPMIWIARIFGMPVAVNLDGIERMRGKWNALGRLWYRLGEICSVLFATRMVADADCIKRYYSETYHRESDVIRYGCRPISARVRRAKLSGESLEFLRTEGPQGDQLGDNPFSSLNISPGKYLLYVSRLEPENNAHVVIQAYNRLPADVRAQWPLVIVGGAPYAQSYIDGLHSMAGEGVIFAGYRYGKQYDLLQQGAYVYIQATEVGGTHPALVEAMGFANCVIANGTSENHEVLAQSGLFYSKNNVEELEQLLLDCVQNQLTVLAFRRAALEHAERDYDWNKIANDYVRLFYELAPGEQRAQAAA